MIAPLCNSLMPVVVGLQGDRAQLDSNVRGLVGWLETTMQQHPMLPLRNMAFWTLDCLLDALQVQSHRNEQHLGSATPPPSPPC